MDLPNTSATFPVVHSKLNISFCLDGNGLAAVFCRWFCKYILSCVTQDEVHSLKFLKIPNRFSSFLLFSLTVFFPSFFAVRLK